MNQCLVQSLVQEYLTHYHGITMCNFQDNYCIIIIIYIGNKQYALIKWCKMLQPGSLWCPRKLMITYPRALAIVGFNTLLLNHAFLFVNFNKICLYYGQMRLYCTYAVHSKNGQPMLDVNLECGSIQLSLTLWQYHIIFFIYTLITLIDIHI